jgi:hypothetical protein
MLTIPAIEVFSVLIGGIGAALLPKIFGPKTPAVAATAEETAAKAKVKAGLLKLRAEIDKDLAQLG